VADSSGFMTRVSSLTNVPQNGGFAAGGKV
jgi:hypothetical protein